MGGEMSVPKAVKDFVDNEITSHKVLLFSKTYCPYCKMAKEALKDTGLRDFFVIELENRDDCGAIQNYLNSLNGSRTVPQVYINGTYIGGGSETKSHGKSGKLKKMLVECGAL